MTVMNIYLAVKTFVLMHRIHARRNDPLNKSSNCVTASKIVKILSPQGHSSVKLRWSYDWKFTISRMRCCTTL